jgi:hypothetical protein
MTLICRMWNNDPESSLEQRPRVLTADSLLLGVLFGTPLDPVVKLHRHSFRGA